MLNGITPAWIFKPPFDLEHKQWLLRAYIRDATKIFNDNRLNPYFEDVNNQIKNLECYNTTKGIMKRDCKALEPEDHELMSYISKLPDDHKHRIEVNSSVQWSLEQLINLRKIGISVWNYIEGSLSMSFIGKKPNIVKNGYMFIRYPGSYIVETYKFQSNKDGEVTSKFIDYDENKDVSYNDVISRYPGIGVNSAYVIVEPTKPFNTKDALIPVVHQVIKTKVITGTLLPPGPTDTYVWKLD